MRRPTLRLRTAVILTVLIPVVLLVALGGGMSLHLVEQVAERRLREDIQLIARALEPPLTRALRRGREGALQQALDSAFSFGRVYGAHVLAADGKVLAGAGAGSERVLSDDSLSAATRSGDRWGVYARSGSEPVYAYFVPLVGADGRFEALLQITRNRNEMRAVLARIRWWGTVGLGVFATGLLAVLFIGHRQAVVHPFEQLLASLHRIAAGARDHRLTPAGPLELRRLAENINEMLDALQRNQREVARREMVEMSLRDDLRQSRRLAVVGEFAAGVAHELGTPLSVVDGTAQRLVRRSDDAGVRRAATRIRDQAARMSHILRQLMDFSRRTPLRRRDVAVWAVVQRAVERAEGEHAPAVIELSDPPDDRDLPRVNVDPTRLEQALGHLLSNAVRAAGSARVLVGVDERPGQVVIFVEDEGSGVPAELRERSFEPFFSTRPTGEGAGLGLPVVHGIAEQHGGGIGVVDPVHLSGARFELWLACGATSEVWEG
ncbi:sensor histidine kinase [Arhodomonas sp. AD133]|uniref:sensor histidine kinase n=1 Tax=Arhodomonas sp. AD133 TaxID=3415009 RepID=UPI003EBE85B1